MQKSFVAALLSSSSDSSGPDMLTVAMGRQRLVGAGFSLPARFYPLVLVTALLFADAILPLPTDTWMIDAGTWFSETLCVSHLSLMTSPEGLGSAPQPLPSRPPSPVEFAVLCLAVLHYKSSQLASHFTGYFSCTTLYQL